MWSAAIKQADSAAAVAPAEGGGEETSGSGLFAGLSVHLPSPTKIASSAETAAAGIDDGAASSPSADLLSVPALGVKDCKMSPSRGRKSDEVGTGRSLSEPELKRDTKPEPKPELELDAKHLTPTPTPETTLHSPTADLKPEPELEPEPDPMPTLTTLPPLEVDLEATVDRHGEDADGAAAVLLKVPEEAFAEGEETGASNVQVGFDATDGLAPAPADEAVARSAAEAVSSFPLARPDPTPASVRVPGDTPVSAPAVGGGSGVVRCLTPVPNSDSALRILRKFLSRTSPSVPVSYGGSMKSSFLSYFFGGGGGGGVTTGRNGSSGDPCFLSYADLVQVMGGGIENEEGDGSLEEKESESDIIVESMLGRSGDTPSKSRRALALFVRLIGVWSRASGRDAALGLLDNEQRGGAVGVVTQDLLALVIDCAQGLVAHGNLDSVLISVGTGGGGRLSGSEKNGNGEVSRSNIESDDSNAERIKAVNAIAAAVFVSDLSSERTELSALKFLLTTGCRVAGGCVGVASLPDGTAQPRSSATSPISSMGEAMLRGTHLLQTIRVCYHVYLKTASGPNKTTARAALQQLVASAFTRMALRGEEIEAAAKLKAVAAGGGSEGGKRVSGKFNKPRKGWGTAAEAIMGEEEKYDGVARAGLSSAAATEATAVPRDREGDFPSPDHRDAFLVLRSLCKLSMRNLPDTYVVVGGAPAAWVGNEAVGTAVPGSAAERGTGVAGDGTIAPAVGGVESAPPPLPPQAALSHTTAAGGDLSSSNPALESKILALDLLLYVLQHTSAPSLIGSGPQFVYAIRNYLCASLLKNCTSDNVTVVNLSLRLFVPLIQHFRSHLKTEIEAFVTNVFFVILDSENSTVEHKSLVVTLFEEICSDPATLAEIFLNYDCDLSAVDLFQRIVSTLARVAKTGLGETDLSGSGSGSGGGASLSVMFVAGAGAARAERLRGEHRGLRLDAMRAVRQVLQSLHASVVAPAGGGWGGGSKRIRGDDDTISLVSSRSGPGFVSPPALDIVDVSTATLNGTSADPSSPPSSGGAVAAAAGRRTLVEIYDSKKRRREDEATAVLKFNQKPSAGIAYASKCGHINGSDAVDVAQYLLRNKDSLEKTQIGEFLGREAQYQGGFSLKVLHAYADQLNFQGLMFDDAIRYYLSGFRLPGEAQKIDRIMEKFAERFTVQNPTVFPTADVAFILAFSVIMLQTDLHNPSIKEERRMTKEGFVRNNRGICDGGDLPEEFLTSIYDRIKVNPFSLKEDDEARDKIGDGANDKKNATAVLGPSGFFSSHYVEIDRTRESNFQKERDQMVRNTESLLRRKKRHHHGGADKGKSGATGARDAVKTFGSHRSTSVKFVRTEDTGLKDEYVTPMFDVTWGPALAVFSTCMESANGTVGALTAIASDEEMEIASKNAAEAIEVCLNGFQLAICTAGVCGNDTARSAFVRALENFSLLGTGRLMEYRHVRCVQTLLRLGRDDGELLGNVWEHVFRGLSEVARLRQLFERMARNDRAAAAAAKRRRLRLERQRAKRAAAEAAAQAAAQAEAAGAAVASSDETNSESYNAATDDDLSIESSESSSSSLEMYDSDGDSLLEDEMDKRAIDEANARSIHDAVSETLIDAIYHRSASLSVPAIKEFVFQLCRVSRMEISGYGGHVGSQSNTVDLTAVHYRQQHTLLSGHDAEKGHYNQPDIYSLQKLVEVAHYNMDARPRLVFADFWTVISAHLTSTALHTNPAVATYAVDSFRQLSIQFLQREELGVFEFQRKFLKPFETTMANCEHTAVKELLLSCVEQIIALFGSDPSAEEELASATPINVGHNNGELQGSNHYRDTLRSGWRPVLTVLGLAGHDTDDNIAKMGFKMLTSQLRQCIAIEKLSAGVAGVRKYSRVKAPSASSLALRGDRFVDLIDALLMFVSGHREEISLLSIDHLVTLSNFLADETIPLPLLRQRSSAPTQPVPAIGLKKGEESGSMMTGSQELELWWPILLGLSRAVGDPRQNVRIKSLVTLLAIINQHFFPSNPVASDIAEAGEANTFKPEMSGGVADAAGMIDQPLAPPQHGDLQTLQLIFRGVLVPTLEHAELNGNVRKQMTPPLPDDFEHFITPVPLKISSTGKLGRQVNAENQALTSWLNTTFDHLMDGCVSICLRSIEIYKTDTLVEEVLAMFNSCLISDSGALAVRGLRRIKHFITDDLDVSSITDDTWATVCHMLRRCLHVRGLPGPAPTSTDAIAERSKENIDSSGPELNSEEEMLWQQHIKEFVLEEDFLADRRYIGSNVVMIVGALLGNKAFISSMGLRWYLFLLTGLGMGIKEWEEAARILSMYPPRGMIPNEGSPPHYLENALYGRKYMVRFMLHLISKEDVLNPDISSNGSAAIGKEKNSLGKKSAAAAKILIKEQADSFLLALLQKESAVRIEDSDLARPIPEASRAAELRHSTELVCSLMEGFKKLDDSRLFALSGLTPTLSASIQSSNKTVRIAVHGLVQRMFEGPLSDRMKTKGNKHANSARKDAAAPLRLKE